jgi:hypothetical protein
MIFFDSVLPVSGASASQITIVERIKRELKRPLDDVDVKLSIVTVLRHWRVKRFHFNEGHYQFNLTEGTQDYGVESAPGALDGYPSDMMRPDNVYIRSAGITWVPVRQVPFDQIRWENPQDSNNRGTPDVYAWYGQKMWFSPVPNPNAIEVRLDYVKDIGIPTYEWDGSDFFFYRLEGSSSEWTEDSTNLWFIEAEELIRQSAKRDLYVNLYEDMEGAMKMDSAVKYAINRLNLQQDNYRKNMRRVVTQI